MEAGSLLGKTTMVLGQLSMLSDSCLYHVYPWLAGNWTNVDARKWFCLTSGVSNSAWLDLNSGCELRFFTSVMSCREHPNSWQDCYPGFPIDFSSCLHHSCPFNFSLVMQEPSHGYLERPAAGQVLVHGEEHEMNRMRNKLREENESWPTEAVSFWVDDVLQFSHMYLTIRVYNI